MEVVSSYIPLTEIASSTINISDAIPPMIDKTKILVDSARVEVILAEERIGAYLIQQDPNPRVSVEAPFIYGSSSGGIPKAFFGYFRSAYLFSTKLERDLQGSAKGLVTVNLQEAIRVIMSSNPSGRIRSSQLWAAFLDGVMTYSLKKFAKQNLGPFEIGRKVRISRMIAFSEIAKLRAPDD